MDLMDLLQGQLSGGMIDQLASNLGGADKQQTEAAANGIISTLMGALSKNASSPEGAGLLSAALDRDHDGSILDDVLGMVTGSSQASNPKMVNGAGILKHVLGGKQNNAIEMISKMSGLAGGQTGNLMAMLAPMVMGALGKTKKQQGLDPSGLTGLLSQTVQSASNSRSEMSLISKFLDQDGDGSVMDDLTGMGMNLLGRFLKK